MIEGQETVIRCPNRDYTLIGFEIDPDGDGAEEIDKALTEAREQRSNPRDTAGQIRSPEVQLKTRYIGALAENLLVEHLQNEFGQEARVIKEDYKTYDEHVDIKIDWNNGNQTTIEVRSSFAYGNMSRVICELFDHIGPYTTTFKSNETPQDFYLRGVLHEEYENSFHYDRKHIMYFAGGVPRRWLEESGTVKSMGQRGARYLTIPLWQGMDAIEIINEIRSVSSGV